MCCRHIAYSEINDLFHCRQFWYNGAWLAYATLAPKNLASLAPHDKPKFKKICAGCPWTWQPVTLPIRSLHYREAKCISPIFKKNQQWILTEFNATINRYIIMTKKRFLRFLTPVYAFLNRFLGDIVRRNFCLHVPHAAYCACARLAGYSRGYSCPAGQSCPTLPYTCTGPHGL